MGTVTNRTAPGERLTDRQSAAEPSSRTPTPTAPLRRWSVADLIARAVPQRSPTAWAASDAAACE
jgi:hypothetical protein